MTRLGTNGTCSGEVVLVDVVSGSARRREDRRTRAGPRPTRRDPEAQAGEVNRASDVRRVRASPPSRRATERSPELCSWRIGGRRRSLHVRCRPEEQADTEGSDVRRPVGSDGTRRHRSSADRTSASRAVEARNGIGRPFRGTIRHRSRQVAGTCRSAPPPLHRTDRSPTNSGPKADNGYTSEGELWDTRPGTRSIGSARRRTRSPRVPIPVHFTPPAHRSRAHRRPVNP